VYQRSRAVVAVRGWEGMNVRGVEVLGRGCGRGDAGGHRGPADGLGLGLVAERRLREVSLAGAV
jgi:hypothetical protein